MNGTAYNFQERAERLTRITTGLPLARTFPLLHEVKIPDNLFSTLVLLTKLYLVASLRASGNITTLNSPENILRDYRDALLTLPNITPNGLVMPKRDNMLEFNILHQCVSQIFSQYGLNQFVKSIRLPAMVRLVDGIKNDSKETRPYASTKLHSDVWNGDPAREILILIPILGDIKRTGIEFFEPNETIMDAWIRDLTDYNAGAHIIDSAVRYNLTWRAGYIYFVDQLVLHRTVKNGGGIRVCVDFHFVPQEEVTSDIKKETLKNGKSAMRNYTDIAEWHEIGKSVLFFPEDTFTQTRERFRNTMQGSGRERTNSPRDFRMVKLNNIQ